MWSVFAAEYLNTSPNDAVNTPLLGGDLMKHLSFNKQAEDHQLTWRTANRVELGNNGTQNGKTREHILPSDKWLLGVWEEIQDQLVRYIEADQIQPHAGKHNLKSSWTQCANTFFPFRLNPNMKSMLVSFLNRDLALNVSSIDNIDLEYAAPGKLSPRYLLGEQGGMRGSGQTSPDVAIQFSCEDGKCGIYLIENKYTENSYSSCSAAKKTIDSAHSLQGLQANPDPDRCMYAARLINDPENQCHQVSWGRKYWTRLAKHINIPAFCNLPYCPAMNDGYQMFRQQALAQGIADARLFDHIISGVAYDERNTELITCLNSIGISDFRKEWADLFNIDSEVIFHCFSHQHLVSWVTRSRSSYIRSWGSYLNTRYGF